MNASRRPLLPVKRHSIPRLTPSGVGWGVNIQRGERKMGKITVRNEAKQEKDWVDWNGKIFEDVREGMFEEMGLDEMIQWVEQKLKEYQ